MSEAKTSYLSLTHVNNIGVVDYVAAAKQVINEKVNFPQGVRLAWAGL